MEPSDSRIFMEKKLGVCILQRFSLILFEVQILNVFLEKFTPKNLFDFLAFPEANRLLYYRI